MTDLLVLRLMPLCILEEHVITRIGRSFRDEHLGRPFGLFGPLVDHGPVTLVRGTILQEYGTEWEKGFGSLALRAGIFLSLLENSLVVILLRLDQSSFERLCKLIKTVSTCCHVGERNLTVLGKDAHLFADIGGQSCCIVPQHGITDRLSYSLHLVELGETTSGCVEEV